MTYLTKGFVEAKIALYLFVGKLYFEMFRYISLKCLCAQVISANRLPFKGEVPEVLETFIEAH